MKTKRLKLQITWVDEFGDDNVIIQSMSCYSLFSWVTYFLVESNYVSLHIKLVRDE